MNYRNPVIPGFYPDPSVCRVGEDYFLVTSTFEYFPGVPVFHSRDLVNWRQIGHCLTRPEQLPLQGCRSSGGIYAPTIRHHDGRFYMVTTNTTGGGNFYVHTDDPAGEWSNPVWVAQGGIDPSLHFADDGAVYFTSNGSLPGSMPEDSFKHWGIYQSTIDIETGKLLSDPKYLWRGIGGKFPEAPHLYRIRDAWYLMIAEGGTEYGHFESIARADSPWGPFESCPHNPILTHRSTHEPIQCTGHAELFEDHLGNWWLAFLAVRPVGYPFCYHLGRETYLAPVTWTDDGWPVVAGGEPVQLDMQGPDLPPHPWPEPPARDDFDAPELALPFNFLRNPSPEDWSLTDRAGWLRLRCSRVGLDDTDSPAWVGHRQQHFDCRAETLVDFTAAAENEEAGLTVMMNERHHYEVAVTQRAGARVAIVRRRIGSLTSEVACEPLPPGHAVLRLDAEPESYTFRAGPAGQEPALLARSETRYLSTEVAGGFTGVYIALYTTANGTPCGNVAHFDYFDYDPAS